LHNECSPKHSCTTGSRRGRRLKQEIQD